MMLLSRVMKHLQVNNQAPRTPRTSHKDFLAVNTNGIMEIHQHLQEEQGFYYLISLNKTINLLLDLPTGQDAPEGQLLELTTSKLPIAKNSGSCKGIWRKILAIKNPL